MEAKFIVFEGITGSGKKTHINLLVERLRAQGVGVMTMAFPNYESQIARLTKNPDLDPYTLSLLFAADRSLQQNRIRALLERGTVVVCDRYSYSNLAYQSAHGVPAEWLAEIEKNIIKPHFVVFIDIPTEVSMHRVEQSSIEDFTKKEILGRLEREKDLTEKIRAAYMRLARDDRETRWYVVDGSKDIRENHEQIWDIVKAELGL
jgi:dTMP kinase